MCLINFQQVIYRQIRAIVLTIFAQTSPLITGEFAQMSFALSHFQRLHLWDYNPRLESGIHHKSELESNVRFKLQLETVILCKNVKKLCQRTVYCICCVTRTMPLRTEYALKKPRLQRTKKGLQPHLFYQKNCLIVIFHHGMVLSITFSNFLIYLIIKANTGGYSFKNMLNKHVFTNYVGEWEKEPSHCSIGMLGTYSLFKANFGPEKYLSIVKNSSREEALLNSVFLHTCKQMIEQGRYYV